MIKLTSSQVDRAKSFILDLCICAGISPNTRAMEYSSSNYFCIINSDSRYARTYKAAADTIMNAIKRRTFNFKEVDAALMKLKDYRASFGETPKSTSSEEWTAKNTQTLAKYLAWCCMENKIYWNDIAYTAAERTDWTTGSPFAAALYAGECFASQPTTVVRTRSASSSGSSSSGTTAAGTSGAPKSSYKTAGPQSANVAGLVSKPGEKEMASSSVVYCVVGAKAGTIVPNAFIHPVTNEAVGERARVNADGLPTVRFGAGNGYTDLTIYSTDKDLMTSIMENLRSKGLLDKYTDIHVSAVKANSSGYYRVKCEYGEVLIKPGKLNEKLFAEAFEAMTAEKTELAEKVDSEELVEAPVKSIIDLKQFIKDSKMYD